MAYLFGLIRHMSLGRLLGILSVFAMVLAFVLIFSLSGAIRDRAVHDLAREDARQTSQLVFQSLYSAMRKGWSKQDINEAIERLNRQFPDLRIRVYRGEVVARQFGAMPQEAEVVAADAPLRKALGDGQETLLFPNADEIRYLYPLQATEECLGCHTQSHVGAVHGVIDIGYPVKNLKVSFSSVLNSMLVYTLAIIGFVFLVLYFKLRYLFVLPIAKLVNVMREISVDMDLTRRVKYDIPLLELQSLAEYFNSLLKTVHEYNVRLEELSTHDPLTDLYNRRKFEDFLHYEIIRSARHQRSFSLMMVDLDNFKYINDTFGHPVGKVRCTASFSLVSYPEDGLTEGEIYSAMDVVLYKAKSRGKNQVMTAESEEDRSMMNVFRQGEFLRAALRENRVEAHLQPIVNLRDGSIKAYEVLARIRDGDVIVPAGEFVEVAEKLGMAQEMDSVVFRKGLAHYAKVSRKHPDVKLFFNLFPRSFNDIEWVRAIPAIAREAGMPCELIVLELTEREALPNLSQVRAVIEELKGTGIKIALDDFGSGFSSFMYLKYLPVDYVKIEGSFVQQIVNDPRDRIMVEHINSMAHEFGLKTIAEFVEDEETARMLAEIGVDSAQGYYFGRPAAPD